MKIKKIKLLFTFMFAINKKNAHSG